MAPKVKFDTSELSALGNFFQGVVDGLRDGNSKDILDQGVSDVKDEVQARVQDRGLGSNNLSLKSYEPSYARKRAKGGLKGSTGIKVTGRATNKVDLTLSGGMWSGYTFKSNISGGVYEAELFFEGDAEKIAAGNEAKRPFTALTPEEVEMVEDAAIDAVEDIFKLSNI